MPQRWIAKFIASIKTLIMFTLSRSIKMSFVNSAHVVERNIKEKNTRLMQNVLKKVT